MIFHGIASAAGFMDVAKGRLGDLLSDNGVVSL